MAHAKPLGGVSRIRGGFETQKNRRWRGGLFVLTELEFGLRFAESADKLSINYDYAFAQYVHG